ncbi:MAG: cobalt ECF transporter T component CbiQ [Desulfocapsaceae bacterium]|nr:cobalt ECF transporter T component CbiQ [Desulfocapsaceae bacterium]
MQRRSHFLEKTLSGITETLERSLFAEAISLKSGLFQSLDPRVKVLATLAMLIGVALSRSVWIIGGVYLLALYFARASAIPMDFFIRRVWLAVFLFTGLIAVPALFITPGPALLHLPWGLVITQTGARSMVFLLLRVGTSVSLVLLLILTTPWNTVLGALSVLKIPDVFVMILGMTCRYIFLLLHIANDMFLSRKSRVVGRLSGSEERHMLAVVGATLLSKSLNMSSEVYLAMVSRGYRGTAVTFKPFRMRIRDWSWTAIFVVITALILSFGH